MRLTLRPSLRPRLLAATPVLVKPPPPKPKAVPRRRAKQGRKP